MIILYHQLLRFFFFAACNDIFLINSMLMLIVAVGHELGVENVDFGGRVIMELQVVLKLRGGDRDHLLLVFGVKSGRLLLVQQGYLFSSDLIILCALMITFRKLISALL